MDEVGNAELGTHVAEHRIADVEPDVLVTQIVAHPPEEPAAAADVQHPPRCCADQPRLSRRLDRPRQPAGEVEIFRIVVAISVVAAVEPAPL